jgi:adenine modification enzyme
MSARERPHRDSQMPIRKPHHPPPAAQFRRPLTDDVGYILSIDGVVGFGCRSFYVAAVARRQIVEMIIARHYSRRVVNNSYVHLGVFVAGALVGALQLGYALNPARASKVVANTSSVQHIELNRMWLDDSAPRNSESRALSYTIKYLKRACPYAEWLQSYADERCGRWGVVYQAANFMYLGSHKTEFYELDGQTYHSMLLTAHRKCGQRGLHLKSNLHRAVKRSLRQFRYIYFLKPAARKRLKMTPKPYPKPPPV